MAAWKYSADECVVVKDVLKVGFTTRGDNWVRFGVLNIPLDLLEGAVIRSILEAHQRKMEGPPGEDTPLDLSWSTQE